jgi:predicted dehydrogenase
MAVIGVGRIGLAHAANLENRVQGARLVAASTSNLERAAAVQRLGDDLRVYSTPEELLAEEELDAVVIASKTSAHLENVERSAAAGAHIFCEKPLALSVEDCETAAEVAGNAGMKLMMGHVRRFDPAHREAKRLIDAGAIGQPVVYRGISGDVEPPAPEFADPAVSGGLIVDSMYHDIYLSGWLMADEISRVYGEGGALVDAGVRSVGDVDNAVVSLRFAGGAMGTLTASRVTRYGHDLRGEVIGDQGAVQIGRFRHTPVRLLDRRGVHHDMARSTSERMGEALVAELQAFVDCILADADSPVTAGEAIATLEVALAATRSIHTGKPEDLRSRAAGP